MPSVHRGVSGIAPEDPDPVLRRRYILTSALALTMALVAFFIVAMAMRRVRMLEDRVLVLEQRVEQDR